MLAAMGLGATSAQSAISVSLGPTTSDRDVERLFEAWRAVREPRPRGRIAAAAGRPDTVRRPDRENFGRGLRMAAVQQTIDQVKRDRRRQVQVRLRDRHREREGAEGPERGYRPLHLREEGRAGVDARVAAGRLSPLAGDARADLGQGALSEDRLPEPVLLLGSQIDRGPEEPGEVDPELLKTYAKLGIPLKEQEMLAGVKGARVAVDAVFDSVSVVTTFKAELAKAGVIFCSISEALRDHPELVRKYLGSVVPQSDNFYASLNAAVFSDGSFVYVPEGVRCPMELSTYFRINEKKTGQFERTLIIADKGAYVSYLEGCTAPMRDENQLHAAVVELVALDDAEIKYSTVQNWYPGDKHGKGGIYNFVTKRGDCRGRNSKISWTQVETGSAITWKYPSCILRGDNSRGEFYSIAVSNGYQQVDSGTKMIHLGPQYLQPNHLQGNRRRASRRIPIAGSSQPIARRPARAISPIATAC